jgi:hypothetical protein
MRMLGLGDWPQGAHTPLERGGGLDNTDPERTTQQESRRKEQHCLDHLSDQ